MAQAPLEDRGGRLVARAAQWRSKKEYATEAQALAEGEAEAAPAADEPTPIRGRKSAATPESDVEAVVAM